MVATNNWKKNCTVLHRTWVSKRTLHVQSQSPNDITFLVSHIAAVSYKKSDRNCNCPFKSSATMEAGGAVLSLPKLGCWTSFDCPVKFTDGCTTSQCGSCVGKSKRLCVVLLGIYFHIFAVGKGVQPEPLKGCLVRAISNPFHKFHGKLLHLA